jgi:hypothetical protein
MRRLALAAALASVAVAMPAEAHKGGERGDRGEAKKCKVHRVAWVVRGTVVSHALAKNDDGTYSGDVVVQVKRTNRAARDEKADPQPRTYTLDHAKARFSVSDQEPANGTVDETDVTAGDRVQLAGKVTRLRKKCDQTGFTAETKIRRAKFQDPKAAKA